MDASVSSSFQAFRRNSIQALSDIAYESILEAILDQRLAPGERLLENELSEKIGVSRTPLREAMRNLEADGFVTIIPRKGSYVASFDLQEAKHLFDVREQIEMFSAREAAAVITTSELSTLREILENEERFICEKDGLQAVRSDNDFHLEIARITKNSYLLEIMMYLQKRNLRYRSWLPLYAPRMVRVRNQHAEILKALEEHDQEKAAEAMRINVESAREMFILAVQNTEERD